MIRSHLITRILLLSHHLRLSLSPSKHSIKLIYFPYKLRITKGVIMRWILPLVSLRCKHSLLLYLHFIAMFIYDLPVIIVHLIIMVNSVSLFGFGTNPCLVVLHLGTLISAYFALVRAIVLVLTVWIYRDLVYLVEVVL